MADGDLSLKGVLRRHKGLTGDINVIADAYPLFLFLPVSLRALLEASSRTEQDYTRRDNCLSNRVKYEQTWSHIRVRIQLKPDNQAAEDAIANAGLEPFWKSGIETKWNGNWSCRRSGELACRLSFEVVYTDRDEHYDVKVDDESRRTTYEHWDIFDSQAVIAHEFGHMIGLFDEYTDPECPERDPVNTGSIMENNSSNVPERFMTLFAEHLGTEVCDADENFLTPF